MTAINDKIYIVIPAFNEEKVIGMVVQSLKKNGYANVLVINDGSTDATGTIASANGAEVLSHVINRGQGAALQTGIEYLRERYNPDIIVTFDADGQHSVDDIKNIVAPIIENRVDIVLGSRFLKNSSNIPPIRKLILRAGVIFTNFISSINLTDTHNGLRALNKKASDSIQISQRGMEHASEIIDEIKKNKLLHAEVPTSIVYSEYSCFKGQKSSSFIKLGIKIIINKVL